jgi:prophage tail gpP-like protein
MLHAAPRQSEGSMSTPFELRIGDEAYSGWKTLRISRSLENACADFAVTVSERWALLDQAWQIMPGNQAEIYFDDALVLTGYVDRYAPQYSATAHEISVTGRSKTCDFVDSSVVYETDGQFKNLTPGQLARQLAAPFKIEVVSDFDGEPIPDAQVQQGETCFALLERLCRLQEILVTDDAQGRLVLTRAGAGQCSTVLAQGVNILTGGADHDDSERFSQYIVKAQRPANRTYDDYGETGDALLMVRGFSAGQLFAAQRAAEPKRKTAPKTLTQITGTVTDAGITRYRPHVIIAESQADGAEAEKRADWEMRRRLGKSKVASISVQGWRQRDGRLWLQNESVFIRSPWLDLDEPLLIKDVQFDYGEGGEITELELVLPDSLLPEPKRKTKTDKKAGGKGSNWDHVIKDSGKL